MICDVRNRTAASTKCYFLTESNLVAGDGKLKTPLLCFVKHNYFSVHRNMFDKAVSCVCRVLRPGMKL
jgi:hypothetical protein